MGYGDDRGGATDRIGAEVHGVDATRPLPPEQVVELRRALLDHLVIFLR